jgi:hypothetical protein
MTVKYQTTADVLAFTRGVRPGQKPVNTLYDDAPLVNYLAASTRAGFTFQVPRKTGSAGAGFRAMYTGRENSSGTYDSIAVNSGLMTATSIVDVGVAAADEQGIDHAIGIDCDERLRKALFEVEDHAINGGKINGFNFNLASQVTSTADLMCINAGGDSTGGCTSVYLIRTLQYEGVELVWGAGGKITVGDRAIQMVPDGDGKLYEAYVTPIVGWVGLSVPSSICVARICNLDADHPLTDDHLSAAISLFPVSRKPNLIILNRTSLSALQQSRTATTPTGSPAPFPDQSFNVPICTVETIADTEDPLDVTG